MALLLGRLRSVVVAGFLGSCTLVHADTSGMEMLKDQLTHQQYTEAYTEAEKLRVEHEGELDFDLLYGMAAYHSGHYYEALFALERVVYAEPENMKARFVLAKTYRQVGDESGAVREFKLVEASNPPAEVAQEINASLENKMSTQQQALMHGYVGVDVGYDNNINSGSNDSMATTIPFTPPTPVLPAAQRQHDMYSTLTGNFQYYQPLQNDYGFAAKADLLQKDFFSSNQFDQKIYDVKVAVNKKIDNQDLKVELTGQNYRLDSSTFANTEGVDGTWRYDMNKGMAVATGFSYNQLRYPNGYGLLDVNQRVIHAALLVHRDNVSHAFGLMFDDEQAVYSQGNYNARDITYLYYDLNYHVDARNALQLRLLGGMFVHEGPDPTFLVDRNDRLEQLLVTWQWRYDSHLLFNTRVGISSDEGNVQVYDATRSFVETGIRYSF